MTMLESRVEVPAGEFKAKCLKLMDEVARTRRPLVITKRGKPVAQLVPPQAPLPRSELFGYMAGIGTIAGEIIDVPGAPWAAESGEEDALYSATRGRGRRGSR